MIDFAGTCGKPATWPGQCCRGGRPAPHAGGALTSERALSLAQAAGLRLIGGDPSGAAGIARDAIRTQAIPAPSEEALALGVLGWAEALTGDVDGGSPPTAAGCRSQSDSVESRASRSGTPTSRLCTIGSAHRGIVGGRPRGIRDRRTPWGAAHVRRRPPGPRGQGLVHLGRWDEAAVAAKSKPGAGPGRSIQRLGSISTGPAWTPIKAGSTPRPIAPPGRRDRGRGPRRHVVSSCLAGGRRRIRSLAREAARRSSRRS